MSSIEDYPGISFMPAPARPTAPASAPAPAPTPTPPRSEATPEQPVRNRELTTEEAENQLLLTILKSRGDLKRFPGLQERLRQLTGKKLPANSDEENSETNIYRIIVLGADPNRSPGIPKATLTNPTPNPRPRPDHHFSEHLVTILTRRAVKQNDRHFRGRKRISRSKT